MRKTGVLFLFIFAVFSASIIAATHSAWSGQIPWDGTTATQKGPAAMAVSGLSVSPNPAGLGNDVTFRLLGAINAKDKASFGIYSVEGKLLKSLPVSRLRTQGSLTWDQKDGKGKFLAAGVYLVRLKTGARTFESKLLLTK